MKTAIIIPSRHGSQRLPQKALHLINGRTLIERVYRRCSLAISIDAIFVATDHESIATHVESFGGQVIMTSPDCPSGTDRVAAAAEMLGPEYEIILNVQGDEPLIAPEVITSLAEAMQHDPTLAAATPITKVRHVADLHSPNVVTVVTDDEWNALYFSRHPIPFLRDHGPSPSDEWLRHQVYYKHIGVYAYRRPTLQAFTLLGESSLERAERLEQLRLLQAGIPIRCVRVEYESVAVDTIDDVRMVEAILEREGWE